MLHVSSRKVAAFRNRIRKKLGISSENVNLFAYAQKMSLPGGSPRRGRAQGVVSRRFCRHTLIPKPFRKEGAAPKAAASS